MGEIQIIDTARVCYEANRAYCLTLGDGSFLGWEEAPEWQRQTCVTGVRFHLDNPDAGPMASHISWLREKRRDGWSYGLVKDEEKKEHPCLVPYKDLPVEQQRKDTLFLSIVRALLPAVSR